MNAPRRRRSERKHVVQAIEPAHPQHPHIGGMVISPTVHPASPEFLLAYCAYLDAFPRWLDMPPLSAQCWRARAIEGLLA